jgi:hypothetical protein
MRMKEMAAMPFEYKYPLEKISKTVEVIKQIILQDLIPLHEPYADEKMCWIG